MTARRAGGGRGTTWRTVATALAPTAGAWIALFLALVFGATFSLAARTAGAALPPRPATATTAAAGAPSDSDPSPAAASQQPETRPPAQPAGEAGAPPDSLTGSLTREPSTAAAPESAGTATAASPGGAAPAGAGTGPAGAAPMPAAGAPPEELFVHANSAYEAGDHARAVALYQRLRAEGHGDGHLDYDLGNAYLRNGELGRAIASYLRAESALPRDQDLRANLAFARKSAEDALAPPEPSAVIQTLFFWHFGLGRRELLAAVAVSTFLLFGFLAARLWRPRSELLRWGAVVALLLLVATAGSLAVHLLAPTRVAVVVPQEIEVHSGTGADTVVRFKLHAGTEVRALERREDWIRIALPDGQQGWLQAEHAEVVSL